MQSRNDLEYIVTTLNLFPLPILGEIPWFLFRVQVASAKEPVSCLCCITSSIRVPHSFGTYCLSVVENWAADFCCARLRYAVEFGYLGRQKRYHWTT
jgi:hypothetical protein